jgi:hypothetical protein
VPVRAAQFNKQQILFRHAPSRQISRTQNCRSRLFLRP